MFIHINTHIYFFLLPMMDVRFGGNIEMMEIKDKGFIKF